MDTFAAATSYSKNGNLAVSSLVPPPDHPLATTQKPRAGGRGTGTDMSQLKPAKANGCDGEAKETSKNAIRGP